MSKTGRLAASIVRTFRYILLLLLGFTVSMGIAFGVVRYMTIGVSVTPAIDPTAIDQAATLRHAANTLIQLTGAYLDEIPLDAEALKPGARQWIGRGFIPKLNELHDDLDDDSLSELPPFRTLLSVAERLAAMAAHPEDRALRRRAATGVVKAAEEVEAYIASHNFTPYVTSEQPLKAPFRL